jgi:hypothetical protein
VLILIKFGLKKIGSCFQGFFGNEGGEKETWGWDENFSNDYSLTLTFCVNYPFYPCI